MDELNARINDQNERIANSKCYFTMGKEDKLNLDKAPSVNFDWSSGPNISGLSIITVICNVEIRIRSRVLPYLT